MCLEPDLQTFLLGAAGLLRALLPRELGSPCAVRRAADRRRSLSAHPGRQLPGNHVFQGLRHCLLPYKRQLTASAEEDRSACPAVPGSATGYDTCVQHELMHSLQQ